MTYFPVVLLGIKVELDVNGTWTDISQYVYQADDIVINPFGRTNESSTSTQASQMTLTLNNTGGRFTPNNASGAYYPYVNLNTQMRLSIVGSQSSSGASYTGYRFWGEVSEWPPLWDPTGNYIYESITVSGIWRRLSQANSGYNIGGSFTDTNYSTIGSPYTRWNEQLAASYTVAAYWPMEDGQSSTEFATVTPLTAAPMTIIATNGSASFAACSAFPGSDAIPNLGGSELSGVINTSSSPSEVIFRFCLFVQSGGDTGAGANPVARLHFASGTVRTVDVGLAAAGGGPITITGYNSSNAVIFTGSITDTVWGVPILCQVGLVQSGSNINWSLNLIIPNTTVWYGTATGSISGTVTDASSVIFAPGAAFNNVAVGQAQVLYANPSILEDASALGGWEGEGVIARFERICTEEGISYETIGTSSTTMGPQLDDTLINVLQMIENTDGGLLYESRDQFGLGYRTLASLQNQTASLTINYSGAQLAQSLTPFNDDSLVRNDVTLANYNGYSVRVYLANGQRSILQPPNGVGTGYTYTQSVSSASNAQVDDLAEQILDCGTSWYNRYPTVSIDLTRTAAATLFNTAPSMRIGDYLQITNMPAFMGGGTEKQLAWGWSENINAFKWTLTFNTIPELPFESSFNPGTYVSGQVPGSQSTQAQAGSVTGATIGEGAVIGSNISTGAISGDNIAVGAITAVNIASASITGTQIAAATITGTNVAAATITGSEIATATIAGSNIAAATIAGSNIQNAAITSTQISGSAGITGSQIANATITGSNIGSGTITATNITNATITNAQLSATAGITGGQIAGGAITATNIASATITNVQIASGSITGTNIGASTITGSNMANATITTVQIANGTITTTDISSTAGITGTQVATGTITGGNIAATTITASNIAAATITGGLIAANTIAAGNITAATITTTQIASGTITATNISASANITGTQIAATTITATNIAGATITGSKIAAATITGSNIAATTITAGNIVSGTITATQISSGTVVAGIVNGTTITGASIVADGSSGEILVYSATPASGNRIGSWSATSGTDGHSNTYNAGIWVYDSAGNSIGMVPGGSAASYLALSSGSGTPSPVSGVAAVYGTNAGGVNIVDNGDGQAYSVGQRTLYTTTTQTISSGTLSAYLSSAVSPRSYRVHAQIIAVVSTATTTGWQWSAPAGTTGVLDFSWRQGANITSAGVFAFNSAWTTASLGASNYIFTFDGIIIISASGTFQLQAAKTGSNFSISANSYVEIEPI